MSKKISQFNVSTSLSGNSLFTFVINGTNLNVPFSDFQTALGVTGSVTQIGDPLGTPILNSPSTNSYNIRNLSSIKGVLASVNAQDGINIGLNLAQSATGVPLITDLNAAQYEVKTLVGAAGITLTVVNDTIEISLT